MSLEILKRMIVLKKINFENGLITVFGRAVVFMPVEVMLEMYDWSLKECGKKKADTFMYHMGYYQTKSGSGKYMANKSEMSKLFTRLTYTGDPAMEMGRDVLKFTGWGDHQIAEIASDGSKMIIKTIVSPVAKAYLANKGKSKAPVCHYLAGLLAGVAESVRGNKYECKETACAATGMSNACIFELKKIGK